MMLRTPSANAPSRSDCSAMTLRSRVVSWIIGASPSSIIHTAHASGDSFTVAAWLSVTLAACTDFANARAVRRTGSVLHDARHEHVALAVTNGVDVDFNGVF